MDGSLAIEMNRLALKRILASLVAMAGLARRWPVSPSSSRGGFRGGGDVQETPPGSQCSPASPQGGGWQHTVTRSMRLAILRILRPAEAATRRLVIALAPTLPPISPTAKDKDRPATHPIRRTAVSAH